MAGKRKLNNVNLEPDIARAEAAAERTKEMLGVGTGKQDIQQTPPKATPTAKTRQAKKSTPKEEKGQEGANMKPRRALYTLRAAEEDVELWKIYSKNAGITIADLVATAVADYIATHPLTGTQKEMYELDMKAMKAKQALRDRG